MKHTDEFGDRMKAYESVFTDSKINPASWMCVRLDGKKFSKYTKGFDKPFDTRMTQTMTEVAQELVKHTHASIAYTQSDEITLLFPPTETDRIFSGKVSKINSVFASIATANFNHLIQKYAPDVTAGKGLAYFDCRVWEVPSVIEASNVILWRTQDARKNSISALFRWTAGAKAMHNLNQIQMKEYLLENNGVDWNDLEDKYRYGAYIKPIKVKRIMSPEEYHKLPNPPHELATVNIFRTDVKPVEIGYYGDLTLEQRMEFIQ
jgi:tRNA(His) 5'-end guanylyltransferase